MAYIEFNHVIKEYAADDVKIRALDNANFFVDKGELTVILGASGAGKTTALNILGGHGHRYIRRCHGGWREYRHLYQKTVSRL